ncbi:MAG: serine/threonine protein kinase [Kofleriaceae bacterium]|nr:serine/threonine protein kinase [Kofleriaceae bacterium]
MGAVYRARDMQLAREVAIKLVSTIDQPNDTLASRLMREAQALAQLSHPNVVAVHDVGRFADGVFVAMELVSGVPGDEWLKEPRPWREVLRVFQGAARGLAAAHAVGLVHRDFKPSNMILGSDGRVRVLDFGLARTASLASQSGELPVPPTAELDDDEDDVDTNDLSAAQTKARRVRLPLEPEPPTPPPVDIEISPAPASSLLDSPLTEVGHIVGTPPFMAPEQHLLSACDARSDQFGFAVSFYRALYGVRPFEGKTYLELRTNIVQGRLRPLPASDVPAWLRDIVLRGLEVDPEARWPSMDAMLEALGRDPDARRRKLALGAAAIVLLAGGGVIAWKLAQRDPADACKRSEQELAGVWDGGRKDAVHAAFAKTDKPYAERAFLAASRALDRYTSKWTAMRTDACLATRVRGEQSAELMDLRMDCLRRRLNDVRAIVDVFAVADADLVSRAAEVANGLPPIDACADANALRAPVPVPADPKTRSRVDTALRTLGNVRALWMAGRYADAKKMLAPVSTEAKQLGWRPLEGEALLAEARLADSTGAYADAAKLYKDAAIAAEAGRDDETAARARSGLVWVTGERLGHYAEAQELALDAAAKIERLGGRELLQAELDQNVAAILLEQGNYKDAEQRSKRVLEIRQKILDPDDPTIASALGDLGDVAAQTGRYDEAIDDYVHALTLAERSLGPEHPLCATLRINLSASLRFKERYKEALEELETARTISERALGADHAQLATIAINTGSILLEQKHFADAAAQFRRASEIWTRALGVDHPNVATAQFRLGEVALAQGHANDATAAFQRAYDIWKAKLGPDHPSLAAALSGLGDAALAEKKAALALSRYERALALLQKTLGSKHPELADTLVSIGNAQLALDKPKRALPYFERAIAVRIAGGDAIDVARTRFTVAKALAATDPARAQALATDAQNTFAAAGEDHAQEATEVDGWLNTHGVASAESPRRR